MWTVSSDVSIQRRHWQPLSIHLWAYCIHPTHDVNDVVCEGWPQPPSPTLFEQWCGSFYILASHAGVFREEIRASLKTPAWEAIYIPQEPDKCECCGMGPTVFRPYPRRLESLTFADVITKVAFSSQLFKDPECWSGWGWNPWPPAQQTGVLPTELTRRRLSKQVMQINSSQRVNYPASQTKLNSG